MKIVIINYGVGNIGSIANMLNRVGIKAIYSADPDDINTADKLILPGVGAFDTGMAQLKNSQLIPLLEKKIIQQHVPVLGICLGMQLLFEQSEEGQEPGLGWLKGKCVKFSFPADNHQLKVPHMGWNQAAPAHGHSLYKTLEAARFYFVHSYHVMCEDVNDVLSMTHHGYPFASAVNRGNVFGVQFHPEKSHRYGMTLLKNFVELN